jgi:plastocyanin
MGQRVVCVLVLAVVVTSCGGSSYSTAPSTTPIPAGPTTVLVPSGAYAGPGPGFAPTTLTVAVGTTVTWGNNDSTAHTATADGGQWNSNNISSGKTFTFKFDASGTYKYHCTIHSFMNGTIVVQ